MRGGPANSPSESRMRPSAPPAPRGRPPAAQGPYTAAPPPRRVRPPGGHSGGPSGQVGPGKAGGVRAGAGRDLARGGVEL